jgi:predicted ATP-grasp superfamily ATP-dependent carboligase
VQPECLPAAYNGRMKLFIFELVSAGGLGTQVPSSLRAEGWAMLAALVEDFDRIENVETLTLLEHSCPRALGRLCRRIGPGEEQTGFEELTACADAVLVIAPEFDQLLALRSRWVLDAGKELLGSNLAAINLTGDKWALARHFAQRGVPTPATVLLEADVDVGQTECTFPAICKPRHGAGSQTTYLVREKKNLQHHWRKARVELPGTDFLLQPLIPGRPASVSFLIGPAQRLALEAVAQNLSTDGRLRYLGGRLPLPEPLARRAVRLGRQAIDTVDGLAGLVGVDLILGDAPDGGQDWIIEINPRPTTSYIGLRRLAEDNLAEALLRITRGDKVAPIRWRRSPVQFSSTGA